MHDGMTMGWSTREVADMAGTTISAIRYYHQVGLLDEPERRANGYKQYGAGHLARVLQIRRLRELGIPLEELGPGAGGAEVGERLRRLDSELAAEMERIRRARSDLGVMLRSADPLGSPPGFESVEGQLTNEDRALMWIYGSSFDDVKLGDIRRMVEVEPDEVSREYAGLDPNSSDEERQSLAERIAPLLAAHLADYPWLVTGAHNEHDATALRRAVVDLYSGAQQDVLRRAILAVRGADAGPVDL